MAEEKKKANLLDSVKELDRQVRKRMVYKKLDDFKDWAREILELKEKTQVWLEELGVEEKDIKRVIDYINEDIALKPEDKKEIRDEMKKGIRTEKRAVKDEMKPIAYTTFTATNNDAAEYGTLTTASTGSATSVDFNVV